MDKSQKRAREIIASMKVWFDDGTKKRKRDSRDGRTPEEQCFDSGVFAAAEFVRRLTRDDALSLAIHECCTWAQKKAAQEEQTRKANP